MNIKAVKISLYVCIALFITSCADKPKDVIMRANTGFALGTTYSIQYEIFDEKEDYKNDIENVFFEVNQSISTYIRTSDISRINKGEKDIVIDDYFKTVYEFSREVYEKTDGYYDPSVGALVNAWGFGPEKPINNLNKQQVDSILLFTGFDKVRVTKEGKVEKDHPSVTFDFNSLGKGYAIDLIGEMLDKKGSKNYIIEVGGEILTKGINTSKSKKWFVGIDSPIQDEEERQYIEYITLENKAMATSGNYRKFRIDPITGDHYVHILNAKTGYPMKNNVLSVSVVADNCMKADAYATAFMVMPYEKTKQLLSELKDVDAYIVSKDEQGNMQTYSTKGFQDLIIK
ncbi:FAD:protein FMN transferase [Kordia antarctica]|uniref:FAD:protein FMN transferase n=1 Tax=Kordia antarctica TaxID=1218801 RepID=A0A7L4ZPY5_9FLAO|nr:FAD:protein FMN transferase [Kordia antarctica]QHI38537.1 FAD:protein FMN transferase [Kordia antarctica]